MINVAVIVGSTRPGRKALVVAEWVRRSPPCGPTLDSEFSIWPTSICRCSTSLSPRRWAPARPHPAWGARVAELRRLRLRGARVQPRPIGGAEERDRLPLREWNDKAAGFVTYGGSGGVRAAEQLRLILAELQLATVRAQVALSLFTDFEDYTMFTPGPGQRRSFDNARPARRLGGALSAMRAAAAPRHRVRPRLTSQPLPSTPRRLPMPTLDPVDADPPDRPRPRDDRRVQQRSGRIPNMVRLMVNSPAALDAYIGSAAAARAAAGVVGAAGARRGRRHRRAWLRLPLAAVSGIARRSGVAEPALSAARGAEAESPERSLARLRRRSCARARASAGRACRGAESLGFSDGQIVGGHRRRGLNMFRAYFNLAARPVMDFAPPPAAPQPA